MNPISDPVANQQFDMDRTICQGDMQKANVSGVPDGGGGLVGVVVGSNRSQAVGQVGQGCMAEKGYVLVKEQDAQAKSQELAAVAAEKARREAAATAAAVPPPKTVAAKKKIRPPLPSPRPVTQVSQPSAQ